EGQKREGARGGWRSEERGDQASGAGGRSGPFRVGDVGRLQLEGEVALVAGGGERRDPGGEVALAVARGEVDVAGPGVADVDVRDLGSVAVDPGQRVIPGGHHVAEVQDGAHAASAQRVDQPARSVEVEAEPAGVLGFDPDRHAALRGELGRVPQLVGDELDIGGQIVERGVPLGAARQHDGRDADLHGEIQQLREVLIPRTPALGIQRRVQSAHVGVDRAHAQAGAAQGRGDLVQCLRGELVGDVIAHSGQRAEVDAPESEIGDLAERGLEGEPAEADGETDDALVKRQLCLLVDGDVRAREVDSEDSAGRTVGLSTVARSALSRFNTKMTTTASSLPSLHTQNLREQALVALREAIVMGSLSPGSHLAEVRLANDLGISRGTLREALRQLQQEGLAVTDGRGRLHVRSLDPRTIRDTFRVRAALESLAARTIAELPAPAKNSALTALEKALEVMAAAEDE